MHPAGPRVGARPQSAQQQSGGDHRDRHASRRGDEDQPAGQHPPPGHARRLGQEAPGGGEVGAGGQVDHPSQGHEDHQRDAHQRLEDLGPAGGAGHGPGFHGVGRLHGLSVVAGDRLQERSGPRVGVDVPHGDVGVPGAEPGHQLRGGQGAAAGGEEVGVQVLRGGSQHLGPVREHPAAGGLGVHGQLGARSRAAVARTLSGLAGQRPRQGVAVHLAGGLGGQGVHRDQPGDQGAGQVLLEVLPEGLQVGLGSRRRHCQVPDEQLGSGGGRLDGGGSAGDARQGLQRGVDLAQLDAATAELDLLVGAAHEQQSLPVPDHEVAGAVGAVPAEGGQRGVLLGVLGGVEVARQPHAADDQLAGLSLRHGDTGGGVHDREVPAVQRQADAHRAGAVHGGGTGHHGGLRGAVGVPQLAFVLGQPRREVRRAGLPAEDQQPDVLEGLRGPQGGQGGHGGDHVDGAGDQPGTEVHAGPHERARGGHQAGAVAPGQPHLLAGGVEGHREAGQDAVVRAERVVLQEDPRLGVDEGGGIPVGDRDPLGGPRGAGGEDDPRVVVEPGRPRRGEGLGALRGGLHPTLGTEDGGDPGLGEDQPGPLVRIVRVHGDIGGPDVQGGQDGDVELDRARGDADADPVSGAEPRPVQGPARGLDLVQQLGIGQHGVAVVEGRCLRVPLGRGHQDVHQGAGRRRLLGGGQLRCVDGHGGVRPTSRSEDGASKKG